MADKRGIELDIKTTASHPSYDGKIASYDIGIIETKEVQFTEIIKPVCLQNESSADSDKYSNYHVEVIGK